MTSPSSCRSDAHSKSRKLSRLICRYCNSGIEVFINKKNKLGVIVQTPVREAKGFAQYVKENFKKFQKNNEKAGNVMCILGVEYAKEKALAKQLANQVAALNLDSN